MFTQQQISNSYNLKLVELGQKGQPSKDRCTTTVSSSASSEETPTDTLSLKVVMSIFEAAIPSFSRLTIDEVKTMNLNQMVEESIKSLDGEKGELRRLCATESLPLRQSYIIIDQYKLRDYLPNHA